MNSVLSRILPVPTLKAEEDEKKGEWRRRGEGGVGERKAWRQERQLHSVL